MRSICAVLALTMMFGCAGSDGRDGRDGADGASGDAGPSGKDGADGTNGATGANGKDGVPGADGAPGKDGTNGTDGADGSGILKGTGAPAAGDGKDGDLYIDTVSRDVYQRNNGTWTVITNLSGGPPGPKGDTGTPGKDGAPGKDGTNGSDGSDGATGTPGTDGSSVRTGAGAPAAGLGKVGDVYIDSATGDLYSKGVGGWTKTGSLKGPAGAAGNDGDPGVDVKDTLGGVRWFAFGLTAGFVDAPSLVTSTTFAPASSAGTFTFTGANQHGRLAFDTAGSYLPGGVDLSAFESLDLSATVTGGAVTNVVVLLTEGDQKGCQWNLTTAAGPDYNINFNTPTTCYNNSTGPDFDLVSVTQIQIGIVSSGAGARTLTITKVGLVDNI